MSDGDVYYIVAHRDQHEIDSFATRYQDFKTELIPQIFKESLGFKVVGFTPSKSWGSSHVIYTVNVKGQKQPLVLRANLGVNPTPEAVMVVEKLVTDKVAGLGVPTNRVLYVDISRSKFPFDFQIQEQLRGRDLEDHFKGTKEEYDRLSFELGQHLAMIHALTFEKFGRFDGQKALEGELMGTKTRFYDYVTVCLDGDVAYLENAQIVKPELGEKIRELFEAYKSIMNVSKGSLVHHDLADHNIMFHRGKISGIFDWEACVVGDPVLDLAACLTWKTHYPREKPLLLGYRSVWKAPEHFKERWNMYSLRTILWKMVYASRAGIMTEWRKQRFWKVLKLFGLK